jgi:hypothetical protein
MWFLAGHHVTPKPLPGLLGQIGSVTECQSPPPAGTGGNPRASASRHTNTRQKEEHDVFSLGAHVK